MQTISDLPDSLVAVLGPELPALSAEIMEALRAEVPEYDRPLAGGFGRAVRTGVEEALRRFLALIEDPGASKPDVYRALGRGELREGRSLDALQAAYRVGARVAWRRLGRAAAQAGVDVEVQHALAEAIFAYIDDLASESVEGYAAAQAHVAGERQRRRRALLRSLLAPGELDRAALRRAAADGGWRLPRSLAVVACGAPTAERVARRLTGDALAGTIDELAVLVVPDPTLLAAEAAAAARALGMRLGIGPAVAPEDAGRSLDWAARALRLPGEHRGAGEAVVAEDRLAGLLVHHDSRLTGALAARALAPLEAETAASRTRLEETLLAWLRHQGRRAPIAAELGVHPQTVRYRVARLRELFGERLDDPDERFGLELALRAGRR
jgi:hypothetical protein